jgi:hypothetical protein
MALSGCNFSLVFEMKHLLRGIFINFFDEKIKVYLAPLQPFSSSEVDSTQGGK